MTDSSESLPTDQSGGENPTSSMQPDMTSEPSDVVEPVSPENPGKDEAESEIGESGTNMEAPTDGKAERPKRRKRRRKAASANDARLSGRRALCQGIAQIGPKMLKTVKLRVLGRYLSSTRGMDEHDLTQIIINDAKKIGAKQRILEAFNRIDPEVDRRNLKEIILHVILLQEETYSLEEQRLDAKVLEYEKELVKQAKSLDYFDEKKHDASRVKSCDTYKIVLEAAWRNNDDVSVDEANLLRVLRDRLGISAEDHRMISANIKKFPKKNCEIHSLDEIHDARKELQREGLLWSIRDESNNNIDIIPVEVANVLRSDLHIELQNVNFSRLLQHDFITVSDLTRILKRFNMDRYGAKQELIERIADSDILPSQVLDTIERPKLADMCRSMGIKWSGAKSDLIERLIDFYDDLSFEERTSEDEREEWFNNYELLASRSYADLRAKKVIRKDLDVEHQFEQATDYLFEELLNLQIDSSRKITKADGRIITQGKQILLWDCKSVEKAVNLQDYLESQFDGYLRGEREKGFEPIAFLVIGPAFTPSSVKLAHQFKARTNWDIALIQADALKLVAERWSDTGTEQPFPVGLFNRTELIDKDRAEFLISLA